MILNPKTAPTQKNWWEYGGSTRFASFTHFFSCFEEGFGWEAYRLRGAEPGLKEDRIFD